MQIWLWQVESHSLGYLLGPQLPYLCVGNVSLGYRPGQTWVVLSTRGEGGSG
jgi:hypothetical protein